MHWFDVNITFMSTRSSLQSNEESMRYQCDLSAINTSERTDQITFSMSKRNVSIYFLCNSFSINNKINWRRLERIICHDWILKKIRKENLLDSFLLLYDNIDDWIMDKCYLFSTAIFFSSCPCLVNVIRRRRRRKKRKRRRRRRRRRRRIRFIWYSNMT